MAEASREMEDREKINSRRDFILTAEINLRKRKSALRIHRSELRLQKFRSQELKIDGRMKLPFAETKLELVSGQQQQCRKEHALQKYLRRDGIREKWNGSL